MIVDTKNLEPGMVVERDVEAGGTVLLKEGATLSEPLIRRLQRWGIRRIPIVGDGPAEDMRLEELPEDRIEEYNTRKAEIEALFQPLEDNAQMALLKEGVLQILMEQHGPG